MGPEAVEMASDDEAAPGASSGEGWLVSLACMSVGLRVGNCVTRAAEKSKKGGSTRQHYV